MSPGVQPGALQGNVLRGYRSKLKQVRYLMLEVSDRHAARRFLATAVAGGSAEVPAIARDEMWTTRPNACFNISLTFPGLKALGVPARSLASFPSEFIEGMAARALKIGDFGASAPRHWPAPFDTPERIHIIASIYATHEGKENGDAILDRIEAQVARAFTVLGIRNGQAFPGDRVHFGYRDSISQPRFHLRPGETEPVDPLGTVLLGHPTRLEGLRFRVPDPPELGFNGTFNAFRVLAQDVAAFESYLDRAAEEIGDRLPGEALRALMAPEDAPRIIAVLYPDEAGGPADPAALRRRALREIIAAQMCGRWRDGTPYGTSPDVPDPSVSLTEFDYTGDTRCPAGSHVRRVNPRGGAMVQRVAHYTRRLVRRGMPYGPPYDPARPDNEERGLLGNFIGANIGAHFEAIMSDWLNLGLHNPDITRSNDPLIGANVPETSWFELTLKDGSHLRLRGFPGFVTARGGAYTFIPSIAAIGWLARLTG